MQYFKNRQAAGRELAKRLKRYSDSPSVVVALSSKSVQIAAEIATELHLPMGMLAVKEIKLPWREAPVVGSIDNSGMYSANQALGQGFLEEYESEYRSFIDQEKISASHEINMMHVSNALKYDHLRERNIIIVSDGLNSVLAIDEALNYLKPVKIARLIAAMPIATVDVIDKLHVSVDEIHVLDVKDNYITTDHYFEDNSELSYEALLQTLVNFDTIS